MSTTYRWQQQRNDERVQLELDVHPSGELALALWSNYHDQYVDIVLTPQQAQELKEALKP